MTHPQFHHRIGIFFPFALAFGSDPDISAGNLCLCEALQILICLRGCLCIQHIYFSNTSLFFKLINLSNQNVMRLLCWAPIVEHIVHLVFLGNFFQRFLALCSLGFHRHITDCKLDSVVYAGVCVKLMWTCLVWPNDSF